MLSFRVKSSVIGGRQTVLPNRRKFFFSLTVFPPKKKKAFQKAEKESLQLQKKNLSSNLS